MRGATVGVLLALAALGTVVPAAEATYPGANGRLVFSAQLGTDTSNEIYTLDLGTNDLDRVTDAPGDDVEPTWSPDGSKIAFASQRDDPGAACVAELCPTELYVINADGTSPSRLTTTADVHERDPAWSPNGTMIAYSAFAANGGRSEVWIIGSDGSSAHAVFGPSALFYAADPTWSPNAKQLAFKGIGECGPQVCSNSGLFVGAPDGSGVRLFDGGTEPNWSPYGNWILSGCCGSLQMLTPNDDRANEGFAWSPTQVNSGMAVWSPDMEQIAVAADDSVQLMRVDGTNRSVLLVSDATVEGIDWLAVPALVPGYQRPKGATPITVPLVLAYRECAAPDRQHGPALAFPSCSHPVQSDSVLTVGTPDANGQQARSIGSVTITTIVGNPGTPEDEADVHLQLDLTDVRRSANLADYTGSLFVPLDVRPTDKYNGCCGLGGPHAATGAEGWLDSLAFGAPCGATADPNEGATCSVSTSIDAIVAGAVLEGMRTTWQVGQIAVFANSSAATPFAVQGVFVP